MEPRFSFNTKINNKYALKGSYTVMNQSLHLLADNINSNLLALNFDRWVPATDLARPTRAQQVTLGLSQPFKNSIELSVEGYFKWYTNYLEIKEGADINDFHCGQSFRGAKPSPRLYCIVTSTRVRPAPAGLRSSFRPAPERSGWGSRARPSARWPAGRRGSWSRSSSFSDISNIDIQ